MVYLDTSSLLKLIWPEQESEMVAERIGREAVVSVSSLTELESSIQISRISKRRLFAGSSSAAPQGESLLDSEPFEQRALSGAVFGTAQIQHTRYGVAGFCRTLDRLHPSRDGRAWADSFADQ